MKRVNEIAEIQRLRSEGMSYRDIAVNLKISRSTAYKYGKTVQVGEKRKDRVAEIPKKAKKRAFARGVRKAGRLVEI